MGLLGLMKSRISPISKLKQNVSIRALAPTLAMAIDRSMDGYYVKCDWFCCSVWGWRVELWDRWLPAIFRSVVDVGVSLRRKRYFGENVNWQYRQWTHISLYD